jgi:hypothetical protein
MIHAQTSTRRPAGRIYASSHGLGSPQNAELAVTVAGTAGAIAATAAVSAVAAAGGTVLGIAAASLIPVVGPAIGLIVFGVQQLIANSGCGQTCIVTSEWANQAAVLLKRNQDAYFALPAPRGRAAQIVALANFDTIWQHLVQQCSAQGTGDAGKACISDRQAGACKWRQDQTPDHPGEPAIGECWNWFAGMRDPIAHDTAVYDDTAGGLLSAGLPELAGISPAVWLPALAIALGVALL